MPEVVPRRRDPSTRDQVLRQAARLFAERGYRGTAVEDIGAACGISGPAVYKHFANKQAILARLLIEISEQLLQGGRAVVAQAEPDVSGYGVLVGRNGKPVTSNGPPTMAGNWLGPTSLNPYRLAQGRAPAADNEIVIDRGLAKKAKLGVGDTTSVQLPEPVQVRIVGIATFGTTMLFQPVGRPSSL